MGAVSTAARGGGARMDVVLGPRGSGKSHAFELIADGLAEEARTSGFVLSRLAEEEYPASFVDLLARVLAALPTTEGSPSPQEHLAAIRRTAAEAQASAAVGLIEAGVAGRALVLLVENVDRVFEALGPSGQLAAPDGLVRLAALRHLVGETPRAMALLFPLLREGRLDDLEGVVFELAEVLTPHLRDQMSRLPPGQRPYLEHLAASWRPLSVSELSDRAFATPQTTSGQLRYLAREGLIHALRVGREVFYEVADPMDRTAGAMLQPERAPATLSRFLAVWLGRVTAEATTDGSTTPGSTTPGSTIPGEAGSDPTEAELGRRLAARRPEVELLAGLVFHAAGRLEDAVPLLRTALRAAARTPGHSAGGALLGVRERLALALASLGRWEEVAGALGPPGSPSVMLAERLAANVATPDERGVVGVDPEASSSLSTAFVEWSVATGRFTAGIPGMVMNGRIRGAWDVPIVCALLRAASAALGRREPIPAAVLRAAATIHAAAPHGAPHAAPHAAPHVSPPPHPDQRPRRRPPAAPRAPRPPRRRPPLRAPRRPRAPSPSRYADAGGSGFPAGGPPSGPRVDRPIPPVGGSSPAPGHTIPSRRWVGGRRATPIRASPERVQSPPPALVPPMGTERQTAPKEAPRPAAEVGVTPAGTTSATTSGRSGAAPPPAGTPGAPPTGRGNGAQADKVKGASTLKSPSGEVNGRTVADAGSDMRERAKRYRDSVATFKKTSQGTQRDEQKWQANLGLTGRFIDLFNNKSRTDPNRWNVVFVKWDVALKNFDATLSIAVDEAHINAIGTAGQTSMDVFSTAYQLDSQYRGEFSAYLAGFSQAAQSVATVTTIVRDISFAAAVGIAVVIAAPIVFAGAGAMVATAGLTGTTAIVAQTGATALALGGMGAAIEGGGQATAALVVEGSQLLVDLCDAELTWQQALDRFDWSTVGAEGWAGMKRGFVDGVLAFAGLGVEKALHAGARVAFNTTLGEAAKTLTAQMMRRALERAVSGGATGGVIGALDAGIKAALDGRDIGEIGIAMERGFVLGAVIGTALGGAAGAVEGRAASRAIGTITDELEHLLKTNPDGFAQRFNELVGGMTATEREAFAREVAGRRFVDASHYGPAKEAHASGASPKPPEHRYGADAFDDWSGAARLMEDHAKSGKPLTTAELNSAHAEAADSLPIQAGRQRIVDEDALAAGGLGVQRMWTALSPQQLRVLESNPHITLEARGLVDGALTAEQAAARFETAVITYPPGDQVRTRMEKFFAWYNANRTIGDPVAFAAAAQREMIAIHPFCDGNGRMSRLLMDHALKSNGLPPALLRDPNIDYMVSSAAWQAEVRAGVVETFETAGRHSAAFNAAVRTGDGPGMATAWQSILVLARNTDDAVRFLYGHAGAGLGAGPSSDQTSRPSPTASPTASPSPAPRQSATPSR